MAKSPKTASKKVGVSPLGDRILVEVPPREEKTATGIIIPETVTDERNDTKRGVVVAVGEGKYDNNGRLMPLRVREGDKVLFQWGDKIEVDGKEYQVVGEANILAILT